MTAAYILVRVAKEGKNDEEIARILIIIWNWYLFG
jgi:hypothetical protein